MQISSNNYSISEILEMLRRRDLIVNSTYQRGTELWPIGPRSYFIDTVLNKFPFPKIYFFEDYDEVSRKTRREIVDGQQRINCIQSFVNDDFSLSEDHTHAGKRFSELDEETQRQFFLYSVAVDVIRDATQAEIVEMFRRMNAYTLPLNEAEKRHAAFQGAFKWAITRLAGDVGEFFSQFGVFTNRQMVRMADQELLAEVFIFLQIGNFSSSPVLTRACYKNFDEEFPENESFSHRIIEVNRFVAERFPRLKKTFMTKPYAFYTLVCAMIFNRYGAAVNVGARESLGVFARNTQRAEDKLLALASAHESKETDGPYRSYVQGCLGGTNRSSQRIARFDSVLDALQVS